MKWTNGEIFKWRGSLSMFDHSAFVEEKKKYAFRKQRFKYQAKHFKMSY